RSASLLFPWSMWAMMQKFRVRFIRINVVQKYTLTAWVFQRERQEARRRNALHYIYTLPGVF
ncbi:MAG: hypothetical protein O3B45_03800, partial [Bacteroidetes bacterium]|nr:hypothetical protein [Bacteroidota bacterium]